MDNNSPDSIVPATAIPDADAQLIANVDHVGRIVGKTSVRLARVVGIFVISVCRSAKKEYDRIKQCE